MQIMSREGIFANYESPSAKEFTKESIDPKLGPRYRNVMIGILITMRPSRSKICLSRNTGARSSWPITQHTTTTQWVASLEKLMGKEKADKFIRDLAATKPIMVESLLPAAERVASGETPVGITYVKYVHTFGERGAPIDYVRLGKMMGDGHYLTLGNKAPHPNAGKALSIASSVRKA
jgi:hypothetical protein